MSYVYLAHHGIKGQKWGVRRYQNPDGTLTPEGRRYYGMESQGIRQRFKEHTNIGDTRRRSAAESVKTAAKKQVGYGGIAAIGTLGALTLLGSPVGSAAVIAGGAFVGEFGASVGISAITGYAAGNRMAKDQNRDAAKQVISGNNFVVSQLTAVEAHNYAGPLHIKTTALKARR